MSHWLLLNKPFTGAETAPVKFYGPVQGGNPGGYYWEVWLGEAWRPSGNPGIEFRRMFPTVRDACLALHAAGHAARVYRLSYNYRPLLLAQRELIVYHRGVRFGNWFALPWGDF